MLRDMAKKKETEFVEEEIEVPTDPAILPNLAFIGDGKPLTEINAQGVHVKMPLNQKKPFYLKEAGFVARHFPTLYKPVVPKGDK